MKRYSAPIIALDLVKQTEKTPREMKVGKAYKSAINYINSFLPKGLSIRYIPLDFSNIQKQSRRKREPSILERISILVGESLEITR